VFTTERLVVGNLVAAIKESGSRGVAVKCDGTYKISYEGDWNLFSVGTHAVRFDKHSRDVVHSYRPFVFAYIKGESNSTLRDLVMPSLLRLVRGTGCVTWCLPTRSLADLARMPANHDSGLGCRGRLAHLQQRRERPLPGDCQHVLREWRVRR